MIINIPKQLQNEKFRFCLIRPKTKKPFENNWQINGYKYNDKKLVDWIENGGNYGVIGGYGNLRIIDIDNELLSKKLSSTLDTFTITTGGGGKHFYILSDYNINHVFKNKSGELRANNYQVIGPSSIHPTGSMYNITNNNNIAKLTKEELLKIIAPLLEDLSTIPNEQIMVDKLFIDKKILPKLNNYIFSLITEKRTKEQVKELGFNSRSERDQRVIINLLLNGFGQYIKSIFDSYPIGDKYKEHPSKDKYLKSSIVNARKHSGVLDDSIITLENDIENINDKVLKNKIDYYLDKLLTINDWLKRKQILNLIAFKIKLSSSFLEKRLEELSELKTRDNPCSIISLLKKDIKEPEYWINPLVPKNSLIIIGGKPESFKSLFTLTMALHIKSKTDLFKTFEVSHSAEPKILYYDLENGEVLQFWRIKYLTQGCNIDIDKLNNFDIYYSFNKNNIKKELELSKNYDIIILDSYRRFLDGTEDKSEVTNKFFNEYLFKLRQMGKTVIIIHHFRKQKIEEINAGDVLDAFRGSGDITAQLDLVYGVFKGNEVISVDNNETIFDVSVVKAKVRNVYPIQNFLFRVSRSDIDKSTKLEFTGFRKMLSAKEQREESILKFIESKGCATRNDILDYIKNIYSCKDVTIDKDLSELINKGKIINSSFGKYEINGTKNDV